jgi:hypothetical protein
MMKTKCVIIFFNITNTIGYFENDEEKGFVTLTLDANITKHSAHFARMEMTKKKKFLIIILRPCCKLPDEMRSPGGRGRESNC